MPLVVIRPQPGCDSTVTAARAMGLDARSFPLFHIRPVAWEVPAADSFDAVMVGSANAMRHG
ncbi:MAG: uroporphyrinogen-III synthase, partial [Novosphingobium sp.]